MNKIYRVVWSKVKNRYIVVPELLRHTTGYSKVVAALCVALVCSGSSLVLAEDTSIAAQDAVIQGTLIVNGKKADGSALNPNKPAVTVHGLMVSKDVLQVNHLMGTSGNGSGTIDVSSVNTNDELRTHGYLVVGAQETSEGDSTVHERSASIGTNNQIDGEDSTGIGLYNTVYGNASLATGYENRAYSFGSFAFGLENNVYASYSFAGGAYSEAGNKGDADVSTPEGRHKLQNNAKGWNSFAYGFRARAIGSTSAALGYRSEALGENSFAAAGGLTGEKAKNAVALGSKAKADLKDSVALGSRSVASVDKGVIGYRPTSTVQTGAKPVKAAPSALDSTWQSTAAAIAVGDAPNGITRQIIGVAAGTADTDAVNVAQLKAVVAMAAEGNDTRSTVKAGENVTLTTQGNEFGADEYTINVKADGKVASGDTKLISGDTVYQETRVQADGHYIRQTNTAAENITALDNQVGLNTKSITNLGGQISKLDSRINRVGAGAAALAGLHPLDFDPDNKWDFAAAYGNYSNANAVAIGAFYRPNENMMFSIGGSFNGGENMMNFGISWKFGQTSSVTRSRISITEDVLALKQQVAALTKELAAYKSGMSMKK